MGSKTRYVVDTEGTILYELPEGSTILTPNSKKHLIDESNKVEIPKGEAFIKVFQDSLPQLASCGLSTVEAQVFFYLIKNIRYESNAATYSNGRLITRENLCEDLHINTTSIQKAVARLIGRSLIAEAKIDIGKVFIVNPFVAMRGNKLDRTSYDLFKHTKWYRDWYRNQKN